jgi:hypothetical protein
MAIFRLTSPQAIFSSFRANPTILVTSARQPAVEKLQEEKIADSAAAINMPGNAD